MNDLDAVTYFYTSSGIALGVTALLFFIFGLWLGRLTWGRFKKRYVVSQKNVELLKTEVANLKRRLAEQTARPLSVVVSNPPFVPPASTVIPAAFVASAENALPTLSSSPSLTPAVPEPSVSSPEQPVLTLTPLPALPTEIVDAVIPPEQQHEVETIDPPVLPVSESSAPAFPLIGVEKLDEVLSHPSKAFTIWTEKGWQNPSPPTLAVLPSSAHTLWTEDNFTPSTSYYKLPGKGFTLWISEEWTPPPISQLKTPLSAAFSVWTESDFKPRLAYFQLPAAAFTLWTEDGWVPPKTLNPPFRSSRAFTLWVDGGWTAPGPPLFPSKAFTLWTAEDWEPSPVKSLAFLKSRAFTVWTETGWKAPGAPALPSKAFSVWTEVDWEPPVINQLPTPQSAAFTLWTDKDLSIPVASNSETTQPVVLESDLDGLVKGSAAKEGGVLNSLPVNGAEPRNIVQVGEPEAIRQNSFISFFKNLASKARIGLGLPEKDELVTPPWLVALGTPSEPEPVNDLPPSHAFTVWAQPPLTYHSSSEAFAAELENKTMRNDFLLGMVYVQPPEIRDNLTKMHGIGEIMQRHLNNHGVFTFKQIAYWTPMQVENFCQRLVCHGRIRSENWVGQARKIYEDQMVSV